MTTATADGLRLLVPREGAITVVPAWRASPEDRAGALSPLNGAAILSALPRDGAPRDLAALYVLATGGEGPAWLPPTDRLLAAVRAAIDGRRLLVLRGWSVRRQATQATQPAFDSTHPEVGAAIAAVMQGRPHLSFEGRQFRFADAEDWVDSIGNPFRVVGAAPAADLVRRMAARFAPGGHAVVWEVLADRLAARPGQPGVLLLRREPLATPAVQSDEPAATPSQLRAAQVAEQDWIEIQVQLDDGTPYTGRCVLALPGGRQIDATPDDQGVIRVDGIDPGTCKLSFADLDASAQPPA